MNKSKSHAFGKDCYLIGKDKNGDLIWLEAASWDCNWYWGFGYIEVYTSQSNPAKSRDINSHSHWDRLVGKQEDGSYKHHINEVLAESVLSNSESWKLSELMQSFYVLEEAAGLFNRGGSHLTTNPANDILKSPEMEKRINEVMLPAIFAEVYKILTPDEQSRTDAA
jgi:hypothetical protein